MQPLGVLGVKVVRRAEIFNKLSIVLAEMQLREVEIRPDAEVDKNLLVFMKACESVVKGIKGLRTMYGILGKIDKVEHSPHGSDKACLGPRKSVGIAEAQVDYKCK